MGSQLVLSKKSGNRKAERVGIKNKVFKEMKTIEMNVVQELSTQEINEINGGFIPLVILGVAFSAKAVAAGAGAVFLAGMGIGAAVAAAD